MLCGTNLSVSYVVLNPCKTLNDLRQLFLVIDFLNLFPFCLNSIFIRHDQRRRKQECQVKPGIHDLVKFLNFFKQIRILINRILSLQEIKQYSVFLSLLFYDLVKVGMHRRFVSLTQLRKWLLQQLVH